MLTANQYRARGAFLRFQHALDSLEQELKPMEMDQDLSLLLGRMSATCRTFYIRANEELFSRQKVDVKVK